MLHKTYIMVAHNLIAIVFFILGAVGLSTLIGLESNWLNVPEILRVGLLSIGFLICALFFLLKRFE